MPRPRKTAEQVRASRQAAAAARWSKTGSPAKRRKALEPALAAALAARRGVEGAGAGAEVVGHT